MDLYEKDAYSRGFRLVAGVDEAGRGPLAGPVVAASVIFSYPPPVEIGIKDSKALTPAKRDALVLSINKYAVAVGVGIVWPTEIDRINILKASLKAMEAAVDRMSVKPDLLLIDGTFPIKSDAPQLPIISGDALSVSIAAASIIAKTARDRIMEAYHVHYPQYNFQSNKGYPTREHAAAIGEFGSTPIHRKSFKGVQGGFEF